MNITIDANFGNVVAPVNKPALVFTDAAALRTRQLIEEDGNANLKLRVMVQGGGCSGFQYSFSLDDQSKLGDRSIKNMGVSLVVDPVSYQYIAGSEIDFAEGLEGANPGVVLAGAGPPNEGAGAG